MLQSQLIEKDSGCSAMLRDNQTDDLTRLFSVYHECSGAKCIDPIAEIFRKHVEAEGMSLVNQVSAVAGGSGEGAPNRKEVQAAEQEFIQKVIDLQARLHPCSTQTCPWPPAQLHSCGWSASAFALHGQVLSCFISCDEGVGSDTRNRRSLTFPQHTLACSEKALVCHPSDRVSRKGSRVSSL